MAHWAERILITGANGHLGRQLITRLSEAPGPGQKQPRIRALVRSEAAASRIRELPLTSPPEIVLADYSQADSMRKAIGGCDALVHLVGIIKESRRASYREAHEDPCHVLSEVTAGSSIRRIVYLSIFGADADSANPCLASRGRAEGILLAGEAPTTLLRVPMVLGPDDIATRSLLGQARAPLTFLIAGGSTLQQPIDSRDVVTAMVAALERPGEDRLEFVTQRALLERVAALHGRRLRVLGLPYALVRLLAGGMERLFPDDPPLTRAMLGVLEHDDRLDSAPCCREFNFNLTPLDETLRCYLGKESSPDA